MLASFIIGFHTKRLDNLQQTLRFLEKDHLETISQCELILVCQDHMESFSSKFKKHQHVNLNLPHMQLPFVTNLGVSYSECSKLIILESDRILPANYFASVIDQLKEGIQITTKNMLKLTKPATDENITSNVFESKEEHRSKSNQIGMRNVWSGNTALMREDFEKAGKMDLNYHGYGWADSDMTWAMESIGVQSIFRDELELHLWHEPMTYGSGDQKKMFIDNGLRFCKKWNQPLPTWFRQEIATHRKFLI